jgi:hypothetical protein
MNIQTRIKAVVSLLLPLITLSLTGCWTAPNAQVQPQGSAGLIQSGIQAESVKEPATVQAVDRAARTITLRLPDTTTPTYPVGAQVGNFNSVRVGDRVAVTMIEEFAVYNLPANGRLPDGATAETLGVNARVLLVDPSYRLLTLQYPNGRSETFKLGLDTKLLEMAPGGSVVVTHKEVAAIHIRKS